jgi:hypothetical protein
MPVLQVGAEAAYMQGWHDTHTHTHAHTYTHIHTHTCTHNDKHTQQHTYMCQHAIIPGAR